MRRPVAIVATLPGVSVSRQPRRLCSERRHLLRRLHEKPDGSWTALRNVSVPGAGRNFNVLQGATFRPGGGFMGMDIASELDRQACPANPPAAQTAAPVEIIQQVDLTKFADPKGSIDVQQLTCGQLAMASQADTDFILLWSSGWYRRGLAKSTPSTCRGSREGIRNVIAYCKANKDKRVVQAMDLFLKDERRWAGGQRGGSCDRESVASGVRAAAASAIPRSRRSREKARDSASRRAWNKAGRAARRPRAPTSRPAVQSFRYAS